jgi:hypothetical protein
LRPAQANKMRPHLIKRAGAVAEASPLGVKPS